MSVKLLKWGNGVGLLIPAFAARSLGFKAGSHVRILVLENEIKIKPIRASKVDDYEPSDDTNDARRAKFSKVQKW